MKLFDIANELKLLEEIEAKNTAINEETGEIIVNEEATIEELKKDIMQNLDEKLLAYRNVIKNFENEIDLAAQEKQRIVKFMESREKTLERLENTLSVVLQSLNIEKKDFGFGISFYFRNYKSYEYDENIIPANYFRSKSITYIDKTLAKEDWKKGILKEGIKEIENKSLIIK